MGVIFTIHWYRRLGWRVELLLIFAAFVAFGFLLGPTGLTENTAKQDAVADEVKDQYTLIDVVPDDSNTPTWGRAQTDISARDLCGSVSEDSPVFRGRVERIRTDITFRVGVPDCNDPNPSVEIKVLDSGGSGVTSDSLRKAR